MLQIILKTRTSFLNYSICTIYTILYLVHCDINLHCVGLQPNSDPPTWVIGSNRHVHLVGGVATRLPESLSPYGVLGSELAPLPIINVQGMKSLIKLMLVTV